jgi:NDP-sugar pyrophosphorylase family protein
MFQVHKSYQIDSKYISKNTKIWQNCVISKGAKIG